MLKLLAIELHSAEITDPSHREACQDILAELFGQRLNEYVIGHGESSLITRNETAIAAASSLSKSKVLWSCLIVHLEAISSMLVYVVCLWNYIGSMNVSNMVVKIAILIVKLYDFMISPCKIYSNRTIIALPPNKIARNLNLKR